MNTEEHSRISAMVSTLLRDHQLTTPFLLFDESKLLAALEPFKTYLPDVRLFYALKANPAEPLVRFFKNQGLNFDVSSAGEIEHVIGLGVTGEQLLLTAPVKNPSTLRAMFEHQVAACVVDSTNEIAKIARFKLAHGYAEAPQIFIRIRIESTNVEVDLNTKFGCSLSEALKIVEQAANNQLTVGGICFHVGTQSTTADNYFWGIRNAVLVAHEALRRYGLQIPVLNIGGGFCDPVVAAQAGIDQAKLYQQIGNACAEAQAAGFQVYAEPGRSLVSSPGTLVTSVLGTTIRDNRNWAFLDDGIYGCFSIKLYENHAFEFHPVVSRFRKPLQPQAAKPKPSQWETWTLGGPTCDSLDVITNEVSLPASLAEGDLLLTPNLGAYSISTASNFNGFGIPDCHVVRSVQSSSRAITYELLEPEAAEAKQVPVRNQFSVL